MTITQVNNELGNVDAVPLCISSRNIDEIVNTVRLLAGSFGGINLEDISAPRCFEIERRLKKCCDIPIFHDDQHGTAVVVLAGAYLVKWRTANDTVNLPPRIFLVINICRCSKAE